MQPKSFFILMVGKRGFEPPTPASRTLCSTRLSHSPTVFVYIFVLRSVNYHSPAIMSSHFSEFREINPLPG